ncbi:HD-GYP domain-containing protein [Bacillus sp. FJAT-45350]|uniref:HD-GYP domain-containing protein n=1 Tax=Bacillus sp. FJAT-45350 TaxID=2011014 RepID=UPI000BB9879A|nr:HD domain-containing phosphohydrolase [Bacillus sp. FJAT-45350]
MSSNVTLWLTEINKLKRGDITLHPIYRPDGYLLINRYKSITESVLKHLEKQVGSSAPIIIVKTDKELEIFENEKLYNSPDFLQKLHQVTTFYCEKLAFPVKEAVYYDNRIVTKEAPKVQAEEEKETGQAEAIKPLFLSPLWSIFEEKIESTYFKERVKKVQNKLLKRLITDRQLVSLTKQMKDYHDGLYIHAINTTTISILLGLSIELTDDELLDLAIATLFADSGFVNMKRDNFVQYLNTGRNKGAMVNEHIRESIKLISSSNNGNKKTIIQAILDHHEYVDGTGMPNRKKKEQISLFGRIITIAQAYDEKLGGYLAETSLDEMKARQFIWDRKGMQFDESIIKAFVFRMTLYRLGQTIRLPKEKKGMIIGFTNFAEEPVRPKVRLTTGEVVDFYHLK